MHSQHVREEEEAPAEISSEEETTAEEADCETTEAEPKEETSAEEIMQKQKCFFNTPCIQFAKSEKTKFSRRQK